MIGPQVKSRIYALAILTLTCCAACLAQARPESKGMGQMTGRDDSGGDRKTFTLATYPEDQRPLLAIGSLAEWGQKHRVRSFGWLDGGFTSVTNASGLVVEAPTPNRFSNQCMLDAAWLAAERSTTNGLSWGFRVDFYAGSDAALLRSQDHFGPDSARWGTEARQAYVKLHAPIVFREGIDWTAGKINIPTGLETTLSPYNQLYSRGYFWIHDASSGTALFATAHADPHLDIVLGTTMGYNTSFILRGRAPSYLAKVLYHPATERKQQFIATVYTGPKPLAAAAGHAGTWQTLSELQAREIWTPRLNQVFDVSYFSDLHDPANGRHNSGSQDAFVLTSYELNRIAALHMRVEWFTDPHGSRAKIPGTYGGSTAGIAVHPKAWVEVRPEIRGDFSGQQSFGAASSTLRHRNQLSAGFELLLKGRLF
jgi:hypothetical protein